MSRPVRSGTAEEDQPTTGDAGPLAAGSEQPLAHRYDVALLDLDGVLYVGPDAVAGAPEALSEAAREGMRHAFVTNNASRTPEAVAEHLRELGVEARAEDVVTSAQAAARLLAERLPAGSRVLVVGGEGLRAAVQDRGLVPVDEAGDDVAAVVQGFAPEVGWQQLAEGTYAVATGLPWIATNMDATVPTGRGTAPGNGALVDLVATTAGRRPDAVAGKPQTPLHEESVQRTGARHPLVVGDRLDTDVEGANNAGTPSLLVLTGVSRPADLVAAPAGLRPTYVARDLRTGLLEPHSPVVAVGDGWRCGDVTVRVSGDDVRVSGAVVSGGDVDGLRALCVAWWRDRPTGGRADGAPGPLPEPVTAALRTLGW